MQNLILMKEMGRDMSNFMNAFNHRLSNHAPSWSGTNFEFSEEENNFFLSLDLPGLQKEDIKIEALRDQITISGERKSSKTRNYGRFEKYFTIPEGVEVEKIEAEYENGVLSLTLPKAEKARSRQIMVKGAETPKTVGEAEVRHLDA